MEEAIRRTMKTPGWHEIRKLLEDEVMNNLKGIDVSGDIAAQYIGRMEAENILKAVFKKLDAIAYEKEAININYK